MTDNHWFTETCAKAFWDQKEGAPYKQLVADTIARAKPAPGERWLDLGCGSGQLSAGLCQSVAGPLKSLVGLDCAEVNRIQFDRLRTKFAPSSHNPELFRFIRADFSTGLDSFPDASFDGVVSGLSISYAQSFEPATGRYTDVAFRQLLTDVRRVLAPSGRFVFSINVPNPRFLRVLWKSLGSGLRISKPGRQLASALRMMWYGRWLQQQAKLGRFHYPPIDRLTRMLEESGFTSIEHQISYAGQAYVVHAQPNVAIHSAGHRRSA